MPVLAYALGEYHRIRGDLSHAAEQLQAALGDIEPGEHQIWPYAAGTYIHALAAMGQPEKAAELGASFLQAGERADLGCLNSYIRMPLAIALALTGEFDRAASLADEALASFVALGMSTASWFRTYWLPS